VGQGAGIAIEDSVVLAREILAAGGVDGTAAIETALRVYQQRRAERARWVVLTGRRRGRMFGTRNPALTFLRDRFLGALPESAAKKSTERLLTFEL
jgi:2-polyprenyl-6-methoxyphenol hydroxylase-like FAD-dependent oxidoreductase